MPGLPFRNAPEGWSLPQSAVRVTLGGCGHLRPRQGHPWVRLGHGESSLGEGKWSEGTRSSQGQLRSKEEKTEKALQTHSLSVLPGPSPKAWAQTRGVRLGNVFESN